MEERKHKQVSRIKKATTSQQFELLIKEVEKVPEMAKGVSLCGGNRAKMEIAWLRITEKLNEIGPPQRKPSEWRKVWTDLRGRIRKKVTEYGGQFINSKYHDKFMEKGLSEIEQSVHRIIQLSEVAVVNEADYSLGFTPMSHSMPEVAQEPMTPIVKTSPQREFLSPVDPTSPQDPLSPIPSSTSSFTTSSRSSKRKRSRKHLDAFNEQVKYQKRLLEVSEERKSIAQQQLTVFSKLTKAMVKQAKVMERQTIAIEKMLKALREKK